LDEDLQVFTVPFDRNEDVEFLKAILVEMKAKMKSNEEQMKETIERQIGSLVSRLEAERDEIKQIFRRPPRTNDYHVKCPASKDDGLSWKDGCYGFKAKSRRKGVRSGPSRGP
jgi:hypothetical protein